MELVGIAQPEPAAARRQAHVEVPVDGGDGAGIDGLDP
jgi:hypothetical protein